MNGTTDEFGALAPYLQTFLGPDSSDTFGYTWRR